MFSDFYFQVMKALGRQYAVVVKKQALESERSLSDPTHHH